MSRPGNRNAVPGAAAGSAAILVLLSGLSALDVLATGLHLPSLPDMARDLGTRAAGAETMVGFLAAFALGQLLCGPLSDHCGRRPVLIAGLTAYLAASLTCAAAGHPGTIIVARFAQGIGAAAGLVVVRAVIRDLYEGSALARAMAVTTAIYAAVPAASPIVGGLLHDRFGWRAPFLAMAAAGGLLLVWLALGLPETGRRAAKTPRAARLVSAFEGAWRERAFRRFGFATAALTGGLFAFLTGAPSVFIDRLGVPPALFGLFPAMAVPGFAAGAALGAWLAGRPDPGSLMRAGTVLVGLGGFAMMLADPFGLLAPWVITLALAVATIGLGLAMPAGNAAAMEAVGADDAGAASALIGALQMAAAALGSLAGGLMIDQPGLALGLGFTVSALLAGLGRSPSRPDRCAGQASARSDPGSTR